MPYKIRGSDFFYAYNEGKFLYSMHKCAYPYTGLLKTFCPHFPDDAIRNDDYEEIFFQGEQMGEEGRRAIGWFLLDEWQNDDDVQKF